MGPWRDHDLDGFACDHREPCKMRGLYGIVSAKNDSDKMKKTGWTAVKSENVNAPVFTDFPMTMECRIKEKMDESEEGYYILAEVVNILVDEKYLTDDGQPDIQKMGLITYEPVSHSYVALGETVGKAFSDGKKLKSLPPI